MMWLLVVVVYGKSVAFQPMYSKEGCEAVRDWLCHKQDTTAICFQTGNPYLR